MMDLYLAEVLEYLLISFCLNTFPQLERQDKYNVHIYVVTVKLQTSLCSLMPDLTLSLFSLPLQTFKTYEDGTLSDVPGN